jgi:hypothetical protein
MCYRLNRQKVIEQRHRKEDERNKIKPNGNMIANQHEIIASMSSNILNYDKMQEHTYGAILFISQILRTLGFLVLIKTCLFRSHLKTSNASAFCSSVRSSIASKTSTQFATENSSSRLFFSLRSSKFIVD